MRRKQSICDSRPISAVPYSRGSWHTAVFSLLLPCLAAMLAVSPLSAAAAPNPVDVLSGDYYRVELIIWVRRNVSEANTAETLTSRDRWQQPKNLSAFKSFDGNSEYPFALDPRTRRMLEQSRLRLGAGASTGEPRYIAAFPRPGALVSQVTGEMGLSQLPLLASTTGNIERVPLAPEAPASVEALTAALEEAVSEYEAQLRERSFHFSSADLTELRDVAAAVNRIRGNTLLVTGSWHQPVPARGSGEQLLIQTGTRTDDLFQLEGSVGVTLGRYLHFAIDLWYYEPELGAYNEPIPESHAALSDSDLPAVNADTQPANALFEVIEAETPAQAYRLVVPDGDYFMHLSQKRRMRSAELHYLDHPKLGVLVRIDPVPLSETVLSAYDALDRAKQ